ncbi:MAG: hypothetical protein CMQ73_01655 [Gammaproteobacteria bacterium]|nr:hypothetical protein [Gammaproteobacteria bacterium]OUT96391.1 MAG: hypothetical protein CBB96_01950 [Gammaproteobacteria bacterium TMED36]|tara:strand:+ start:6309 stop:7346 length:1038 start_codon:yes stop_codon:yes gene_type:complete
MKSFPLSVLILSFLIFSGHAGVHNTTPYPITELPWQEAVISVTDLEKTAEFFKKIGGFKELYRGQSSKSSIKHYGLTADASAEELLLSAKGSDVGFIRLIRFDNTDTKKPMRPGSRAWDTGCYFSLMVRMKGLREIYDEAIEMGWWTETPVAEIKFGESRLDVVIFKGPDGLQIQGYDRLEPPLPESFPEFDRISQPFNIMQMIKNRENSRKFFVDLLGFDTFFYGVPFRAQEEAVTPLGIPLNLTTKTQYRTAIYYPVAGELGRVEMIEFMDIKGLDHSEKCHAPNLGLLSIKYSIEDMQQTLGMLKSRGLQSVDVNEIKLQPYGDISIFSLSSPDGAIIEFYE